MNGLEVLVERPERHYLFKNPESEKVKELQELEGYIRRLARGMSESSLQIGVYLKEIRDKLLYYYEGVSSELPEYQKKAYFSGETPYCYRYFNFYEYTEKELGFGKSTVVRLIQIVERFCEAHGVLKPRFEDFSFSQLCEMVSMAEDRLDKVRPEMTVREIRAYKKSLTGEAEKTYVEVEGKTEDPGATSHQEEEEKKYKIWCSVNGFTTWHDVRKLKRNELESACLWLNELAEKKAERLTESLKLLDEKDEELEALRIELFELRAKLQETEQ